MEENPNRPDKFPESPLVPNIAPWQMSAPKVRVVLLALLSGCIFFALASTFPYLKENFPFVSSLAEVYALPLKFSFMAVIINTPP